MKQFTVVFLLARIEGTDYILLGEQNRGRPLAGYLNGYGGKVEDTDESILKAAERELAEELDIALLNPAYIGSIVHQTKEIFFYLATADHTLYKDTGEMVNNTWFPLNERSFDDKMLPGDVEIIDSVRNNINNYFENKALKEFHIVKEGLEIDKAVQELNKSIGYKI